MRQELAPWGSIQREWVDETVFIVGGGTSVLTQDLSLLRGRRVLAINSSYESVPFADELITHDPQWIREHREKLNAFAGRIVLVAETLKPKDDRLIVVRQKYPPGLSVDPALISMRRTTFTGAINLAVLRGAKSLVLLGADGKLGADGRSHHHAPHKWWKFRADRWMQHRAELQTIVEPLRRLGVDVVNASPSSVWDLWPVMSLDHAIANIDRRRAA